MDRRRRRTPSGRGDQCRASPRLAVAAPPRPSTSASASSGTGGTASPAIGVPGHRGQALTSARDATRRRRTTTCTSRGSRSRSCRSCVGVGHGSRAARAPRGPRAVRGPYVGRHRRLGCGGSAGVRGAARVRRRGRWRCNRRQYVGGCRLDRRRRSLRRRAGARFRLRAGPSAEPVTPDGELAAAGGADRRHQRRADRRPRHRGRGVPARADRAPTSTPRHARGHRLYRVVARHRETGELAGQTRGGRRRREPRARPSSTTPRSLLPTAVTGSACCSSRR